jgi:hypothetical protein
MKPTMFAAGLAALAAAAVLPHAALAQAAACNWYADTALKQQQQNQLKKCGFKGPEWHFDRQAHLTWCATQTPDKWKAEAQRRAQLLSGCGK